jgi:hypothetical protein
MSDDPGFPEGPLIDARSPAERWAEAGRAGFDRVRAMIENGRLDLAGLWWMRLLLVYAGLQIYSALRGDGFGSDWWTRTAVLSSAGGLLLIFGSVAGVVLAAFFDTSAARRTLRLAVAAGAWVVLAGFVGVVVSFHADAAVPIAIPRGGEGKVVSVLFNLCYAGLGGVVAVLARQLLNVQASQPYAGVAAATP